MIQQRIFKTFTLLTLCLLGQLTLAQGNVSTTEMETLVSTKVSMELDGDFNERFKIQLFYGDLNGANRILSKYRSLYTQWSSSLEYESPNHKVWVGNFRTRLEADRALMEIAKEFPRAFIFKPNN